jgi:tRNA(Ile)-lysidine synthase
MSKNAVRDEGFVSHSIDAQTVVRSLAHRVAETTRTQRLFQPGERILVALSGGPDSVTLLTLLAELAPTWKLGLSAIHINHGLRGQEAEEDARFAASLCAQLDIPFLLEHVTLTGPGLHRKGRSPQGSLQERAREARYEVLARIASELDVDRIALGHTADDQAETLLMWMLRGAGMTGLAGIPPAREGRIVRPLLDITREEILDYLRTRGLAFRNDSSNTTPRYLRNRIRHELLPALKRFNPSVVQVLKRQADIFREDDRYLQQQVILHLAQLTQDKGDGEELLLDRAGFLALPLALQRRVMRMLIRQLSGIPKGPSFKSVTAVIDRIVHGRSGSAITVHEIMIAREYDRIRFGRMPGACGPRRAGGTELAVTMPSAITWPLSGQTLRIHMGHVSEGGGVDPREPRCQAIFDAGRITAGSLLIRSWQPGDWFQPLGMQGRKKLQDFFADIKLPREERRRIPLLVAPEGILWVVGLRTDHRFRVTSTTTQTVIVDLSNGTSQGGTS